MDHETQHAGGVEPHPLLHWKDVKRLIGLSRGTVFTLRTKGLFPAPVRLGPNRVAWRAHEIAAWIQSRPLAQEAAQ